MSQAFKFIPLIGLLLLAACHQSDKPVKDDDGLAAFSATA
jgi:hypothetical protein